MHLFAANMHHAQIGSQLKVPTTQASLRAYGLMEVVFSKPHTAYLPQNRNLTANNILLVVSRENIQSYVIYLLPYSL